MHLAKYGYAYYATDLDPLTFFVRDQNKFDRILKKSVGRRIWAITTFERALRIDFPAIDRELQEGDWIVARRIPATIGDGNILIYRSELR